MKVDTTQKLYNLKKKSVLLLLFLVFVPSINMVGTSLLIEISSNPEEIGALIKINNENGQGNINDLNLNHIEFTNQILPDTTLWIGNRYGTISFDKSGKEELLNHRINGINETEFIIQISLEITSCESNDLKYLLYSIGLLGFFSALEFGVVLGKNLYKSRKDEEKNKERCAFNSLSLIEYETFVLHAVQEYMGKNRVFEIDKIIPYIISKCAKTESNLNNLGIRDILNSFLGKKLIVENSKLMRETILENPNRISIFNYIIDNPGVHFMKLARNLDISNFLLRWHLDMLIKFNLIKNMKIGNFEIFFDIKISQEDAILFHVISKEKCSKIIKYFREGCDFCTKHHLAKTLGMHPNTIAKYINQLDEFGLIYKRKSNGSILYSIKGKILEEFLS